MTLTIKKVSPSQLKMYLECPRKWYYSYVLKQRAPSTTAHILGSRVHKHLEDWLNAGTPPEGEHAHLAQAIIDSGHIERGEHIIGVERRTNPAIGFGDTGVTLNGIVDVVERRADGGLVITDFKTTSSFKWLKTPAQLLNDVQAICYSRWASLAYDGLTPDNTITFRLIYVNKKNAKVVEVSCELTLAHLGAKYGELTEHVKAMRDLALQDLTQAYPERTACSNYGGCHVLGTCRHVPFGDTTPPSPFTGINTGEDDMAKKTLKEILAAKRAKSQAAQQAVTEFNETTLDEAVATAPAPAPAPVAQDKPRVDIIPPDAPADQGPVPFEQRRFDQLGLSRRTANVLRKAGLETPGDVLEFIADGNAVTDISGCGKSSREELEQLMGDRLQYAQAEVAYDQAKQDLARTEAMVDEQPLPPAAQVEREAPAPKTMPIEIKEQPIVRELMAITLMIDCVPTKVTGLMGPVHHMSEVLQGLMLTHGGLAPDEYYNAAPYAEGPRKLAALVLQHLDELRGKVLLVNSSMPSSPYILEVLEPLAALVIRGGR